MQHPCRSCGRADTAPFLDLGAQPQAGWFPTAADPVPDPTWPLRPVVCPGCWLVQLADDGPDEFEWADAPSPLSSVTMAAHASAFVRDLAHRGLARHDTTILEVASHGGYLQPFFAAAGIETTLLEPQAGRARRARAHGARVLDVGLSELLVDPAVIAPGAVHLIVDHYLLAHLAEPDAAFAAIAGLLAPDGTAVLEFDHLLPTMRGLQFDAFRHGHRTYLSLTWLTWAAARHGLAAVEAQEQPVYGGALRVFLRHRGACSASADASVARVLAAEHEAGLDALATYHAFADAVVAARAETLTRLAEVAEGGASIVAYGAPARAVTLLNYYNLDARLVPFTVDAARAKQGRFIPGVRLPIRAPADLLAARPEGVLILTWDIAPEVMRRLAAVASWGGQFFVPVPRLVEA